MDDVGARMTRRAFLAGLAALGLLPACSDSPLDLPVNDDQALRARFDPAFEALGQRVTRAGLFDLEAGYVPDDQGTHLALYVEPIDPDGVGWTIERYIDTLVPGVVASAPVIFATWSDVTSMDICQEPPQAEAPEPQPPVRTQVVLERADAALVDWDTVTFLDLLTLEARRPSVRVGGAIEVDNHPRWLAAERRAQRLVADGG